MWQTRCQRNRREWQRKYHIRRKSSHRFTIQLDTWDGRRSMIDFAEAQIWIRILKSSLNICDQFQRNKEITHAPAELIHSPETSHMSGTHLSTDFTGPLPSPFSGRLVRFASSFSRIDSANGYGHYSQTWRLLLKSHTLLQPRPSLYKAPTIYHFRQIRQVYLTLLENANEAP